MYQDTLEIVNGLQKTKEVKKVEEYMSYLSDIMARFPKAKNYFIKQAGLTLFIDLLDKFASSHSIVLAVLSFLNQITENDTYFLETACLLGERGRGDFFASLNDNLSCERTAGVIP